MVAPSLRISQCRQHMKGPKDQVDIQCIALPIHQYPITAGLSATAGLPRLCARVFAVVLIAFGGALGLLGLLGLLGGGWQLVVKRRRRLYFEVRPGSCFGASSSIWWRHVVPSSEKIDAERVYNVAKSRLVLGCIVMSVFHPGPEVARIESLGFFLHLDDFLPLVFSNLPLLDHSRALSAAPKRTWYHRRSGKVEALPDPSHPLGVLRPSLA